MINSFIASWWVTRKGVLIPSLVLSLAFGCADEEPKYQRLPKIGELQLIGFQDKYAIKLAWEEPYLYVCACDDGLWRRNLQQMTQWEYLGLADSSLGHFTNVGVLDVAVNGSMDIVVAYNMAVEGVDPDSSVAVWRSSDFGTTWQHSDAGIPESRLYPGEYSAVNALQQAPEDPNLIIAVYGPAIYRSTDRGMNWAFSGAKGIFVNTDNIRWDPFRTDEVWTYGETSLFTGYLHKSTDAGITFGATPDFISLGIPSGYEVSSLAFDVADETRVFVATPYAVIRSTDHGESWQIAYGVIPNNGYASCIVEDPRRPHTLFLAGGGYVYYSSDGAVSADIIAELPQGHIYSLLLDQKNAKLIIGTNEGIFLLPVGS
jgi:hypothetical protein